jgi:ankyrin repeat protein
MWAAWRGRASAVQALLEGGALVNERDDAGATALVYALSGRYLTTVQALLAARDVDPNLRRADGVSPLMLAVGLGDADIVKALLDKGADVNSANPKGFTVLMYAAGKGDLPVVKALLEKGAEVDAEDQGHTTALLLAERQGHASVVKALRAKKAGKDDDTWP